MGKALYRKYRPTSFEGAVGQEHITQTLNKAIKSGKISHAYLFTGPRGIGKTSVARILAHEVNGIPYKDDSIHLDIIEIDAASNRRIDEISGLRDKVHIAPTSAKYKVYIIDEVHMLTREAFNALLKTLEEPPAHCIFILATTEVHKLPDTIISRTQRFNFKPADKKVVADYLSGIAKKETININREALELLAEHGQGSFRDSMSLLDQLSTTGEEITGDTVRTMLGVPAEVEVEELLVHISQGNSKSLLENLEALKEQGNNPLAVAKETGKQLRAKLINGSHDEWIPSLLRQLIDVSVSANPADILEVALLEAASLNNKTPADVKPPNNVAPENVKPEVSKLKTATNDEKNDQSVKGKVIAQEVSAKKEVVLSAKFDMKHWQQVLEYAKNHATSLYTALRLCKPAFSNGVLTLYFKFPLHQKKLNQAQQKDFIGQIIEEVAGSKVRVECEVNKEKFNSIDISEIIISVEPTNKPRVAATTKTAAPLNSISNIFGSAEVIS
jgi:DNA polymerase III subunit gamma/tau